MKPPPVTAHNLLIHCGDEPYGMYGSTEAVGNDG
jgi:hypothetical protein